MNSLSQRIRPKHQVLVLKCYPRTTKGAVDVKPNSSELSYLLFYAISRRSKIQKVGQFLEKKTASDTWRLRIGNVQVTLQILAALIEKSPKDLPLFAQNVLKILGLVLHSNDITMVEASLPTFATFCEHHDASSLFADQAYLSQYEDIVRTYASFASTRHTPGKGTPSKPVVIRWRNAGLAAVSSVAESDALSSVAGRQLDTIVPMLLENLWTNNDEFLQVLIRRLNMTEKGEASSPVLPRRTSISTVKTTETGGDTNPIAISGDTLDMDRLAEEEVGVLAMQCLKQIFVIPNRAQMFGATKVLLQFIKDRMQNQYVVVKTDQSTGRDSGWAITIFELITRWAPVQDRYVILVTTMDMLLKTQQTTETLAEQNVLAAIIGSLLRSDINLIGLSVMDVLMGLLQHMKRILKHPGYSAGNGSVSADPKTPPSQTGSDQDSAPHRDLLQRIQRCVGDLATHVYYADQISDMISAVLARLKPHSNAPISSVASSPPANKTEIPLPPDTSTGNISEDQRTLDSFFALDSGKVAALRAIKAILLVANPRTKISGNVSLARNKVPIHVWEGTHWLLNDPDGQVRKAYTDALVTWLDRETTRPDLEATDEYVPRSSRSGHRDVTTASLARRAVSSASTREKPTKIPRSTFLRMLHIAIYDNALQYTEYETDMTLLYILAAKLVMKLGVNAARFGVPMIFRLQEDIQDAETPLSKVRLGCLCHGYFWALSEHFDFQHTVIGLAIQNEVERRRTKHFWIEGITFPPPPLELAGTPGMARPEPRMPTHEVESEALLPFDERLAMVEYIFTDYNESSRSPPASPPGSPGRTFAQPLLGSTLSSDAHHEADSELLDKFRGMMLSEWSRESAMAALQAGSRATSLDGSRVGTATTKSHPRGVNGNGRPVSNYASPNNLQPGSHGSHLGPAAALRQSSVPSRGSGRSSSSRGFVASIDQLKSVLNGDSTRPATFRTIPDEEDSDSMVSCEMTSSELSFAPPMGEDETAGTSGEGSSNRTRSRSRERTAQGDGGGPLSSHPPDGSDDAEEPVPPVPPLPSGVVSPEIFKPSPDVARPPSAKDYAFKTTARSIKTRGGESVLSASFADSSDVANTDLQSMLKGIDSRSRENTVGSLTKPPY